MELGVLSTPCTPNNLFRVVVMQKNGDPKAAEVTSESN